MSASDLSGLSCSQFCRYHCLTSAVHAASTDRPRVVGVLVELNTVTHDDVGRRTAVYCEQQRTKDEPLPTSSPTAGEWCWPSLTNCVRWWCVSHAKLGLETLKQDLVINCVEGGRQIETDEDSDLLVIGRSVHSIDDLQQRCYRRKLNFSNAFNCIRRDVILDAVAAETPEI